MLGVLRKIGLGLPIILSFIFSDPALSQTPREWDGPLDEIEQLWRVRKEVISLGSNTLDQNELEEIAKTKSYYRLDSLPEVSLALIRENSDRTTDDEKTKTARLQMAEQYTPNLSATNYFRCNHTSAAGGFGNAIKGCITGVKQELTSNKGRLRFLSNTFLVLFYSYLIATTLFFLTLLHRYLGFMSHHWAHQMNSLNPLGIKLLLALFLICSWILLGPIGPFLLIMIIFWRYWRRKERAMVGVLALIAMTLPFALYAPALQLRYYRGIEKHLERTLEGPFISNHAEHIQTWLEKNDRDAEAAFSLALIEKRTGRYKEARRLFEKAKSIRPRWHKPAVNLAVLDFIEDKQDNAINKLKKAISLKQDAIIAHFNIGQIYLKQTRLAEATTSNRRAREIDQNVLEQLKRQSRANDPRLFLIDETLSNDDLSPRIWSIDSNAQSIRDRLFGSILPMFSIPVFWVVIFLILIASELFCFFKPAGRKPRSCEKCGGASCSICEPMLEHESLCAQCYHMYVRLESMEHETRKAKEVQISRHRAFRAILEKWSVLILPGVHHLYRGNLLLGTCLLLVTLATFFASIGSGFLLNNPNSIYGVPTLPTQIIGVGVLGATYMISLYGAVRK